MNTSIHILAAALTAASLHSAFAQETIHVSTRLGFLRVSLDQWHYARAQCLTCFFFLSSSFGPKAKCIFQETSNADGRIEGSITFVDNPVFGTYIEVDITAGKCVSSFSSSPLQRTPSRCPFKINILRRRAVVPLPNLRFSW